jgi:hypothetical protein
MGERISHPAFLQGDYNIGRTDAEWCSRVIRLAEMITPQEFQELVWDHIDVERIPFKRRSYLRARGLLQGKRPTMAFKAVDMFVHGRGLWQFEPFNKIRTDHMPKEFQTEWWRDTKIPLIPWSDALPSDTEEG